MLQGGIVLQRCTIVIYIGLFYSTSLKGNCISDGQSSNGNKTCVKQLDANFSFHFLTPSNKTTDNISTEDNKNRAFNSKYPRDTQKDLRNNEETRESNKEGFFKARNDFVEAKNELDKAKETVHETREDLEKAKETVNQTKEELDKAKEAADEAEDTKKKVEELPGKYKKLFGIWKVSLAVFVVVIVIIVLLCFSCCTGLGFLIFWLVKRVLAARKIL